MSRMRFIRISPTTTASAIGSAPPDSDVPAPRGTTRTPFAVAEAHDRGDLFGGFRQHHGERQLAVGGQAVGLVGLQAERLGDDRVFGQQRAQAGDDGVAAGEHVRLGFRQSDHGEPPQRNMAFGWGRGKAARQANRHCEARRALQ